MLAQVAERVDERKYNNNNNKKKMSKKKIARRSTLKPFVKIVNYNHILPTRFLVTGEFAAKEGSELKTVVTEDKYSNKESRKNLKKEVKAIFTER